MRWLIVKGKLAYGDCLGQKYKAKLAFIPRFQEEPEANAQISWEFVCMPNTFVYGMSSKRPCYCPFLPYICTFYITGLFHVLSPYFPPTCHLHPHVVFRDLPRLKRTRNLRHTNSRWSSCKERSLATSSWAWLNRLFRVAPACEAITA